MFKKSIANDIKDNLYQFLLPLERLNVCPEGSKWSSMCKRCRRSKLRLGQTQTTTPADQRKRKNRHNKSSTSVISTLKVCSPGYTKILVKTSWRAVCHVLSTIEKSMKEVSQHVFEPEVQTVVCPLSQQVGGWLVCQQYFTKNPEQISMKLDLRPR